MLPADWLRLSADLAADLATQFDELRRAHAEHPRPVLAMALDSLCMQLQIVGKPWPIVPTLPHWATSSGCQSIGHSAPAGRRAVRQEGPRKRPCSGGGH